MPDMTAISGLLTSLKASTDLSKAMLGIRDAQLVREKAVELTAVIMTAQSSALAAQAAQAELAERVRELEKQVVELEDWNREKGRYQLAEVGAGVFAYETKPGMEAGEPPHKICPNCYQQRRKGILQSYSRTTGMTQHSYYACQACNGEIVFKSEAIRFDHLPDSIRSDRSLW